MEDKAKRSHHIEDCGEGSTDIVERNSDVFQTQVVEADHRYEYNRQGQHLKRKQNRGKIKIIFRIKDRGLVVSCGC